MQLTLKKYIEPYNILNIGVTTNDCYNEYEIPPCEFNGISWIDTIPDSYDNPLVREAIIEALPVWITTKEAYKSNYLETYKPTYSGLATALSFAEIEASLLELINNDSSL